MKNRIINVHNYTISFKFGIFSNY